jgi:hypothetical protein
LWRPGIWRGCRKMLKVLKMLKIRGLQGFVYLQPFTRRHWGGAVTHAWHVFRACLSCGRPVP